MAGGGTRILRTPRTICEPGRPPNGARLKYRANDHVEFVLPPHTKREDWPLTKR